MDRRFLSLAPLAPALAIIAFAAAGAAAQGLASARASALEDVQVGEAGSLLRVALICRADCKLAARSSGVFFLPGVETSLDIDLAGRSANAERLTFQPAPGGSTLTISAGAPILAASIKRCEIDKAPASCIDLEFAAKDAKTVDLSSPRMEQRPESGGLAGPARAEEKTAEANPASAPEPPVSAEANPLRSGLDPGAGRPALREAPGEERLIFARFAPPERFDPPGGAPPFNEARSPAARRPIIDREKAQALIAGGLDVGAAAGEILGRSFGVGECSGAEARLRTDAWALDAMVDVGFCRAIAGDLEAADGVFIRLLEFTPDNYEALVGRALIAARAGEKGVARKYFQDALNALPPIEESDRIVKAMAEL